MHHICILYKSPEAFATVFISKRCFKVSTFHMTLLFKIHAKINCPFVLHTQLGISRCCLSEPFSKPYGSEQYRDGNKFKTVY